MTLLLFENSYSRPSINEKATAALAKYQGQSNKMTEGALRRYRGHISKTNESGNTKPHVLYKSESNEKNQKSNPRESKETAKAEREPFEAKNVIQFGCPIERERERNRQRKIKVEERLAKN